MEFAFASKALRGICEDDSIARKKFGEEVSRILVKRLADLRAASSITGLPPGYPYTVQGEEAVFELCQGYQLTIAANHPDNPVTDSGNVDWSRVHRIKVIEIASSHD